MAHRIEAVGFAIEQVRTRDGAGKRPHAAVVARRAARPGAPAGPT
jgi:hypothetical protein